MWGHLRYPKETMTMSKTDKTPEPRSVRLTQAHRQDMLAAVMQEWERQNPAPCQPSNIELFKLVIREIKKHPDYKAALPIINSVPEHRRNKVFRVGEVISVRFVDKDGNTRDTKGGYIPLSVAREHGLVSATTDERNYTRPGSSSTLLEVDPAREDVSPNYLSEYDGGVGYRYSTFTYLALNGGIMVTLSDDLPAMKKIKEGRKALKEWEQERARLREETSDLLAQFNTTKQLRDGWPDMVPYMPPHIADPEGAVRLPVLATSRLSQRLGLKKRKAV